LPLIGARSVRQTGTVLFSLHVFKYSQSRFEMFSFPSPAHASWTLFRCRVDHVNEDHEEEDDSLFVTLFDYSGLSVTCFWPRTGVISRWWQLTTDWQWSIRLTIVPPLWRRRGGEIS